MRRPKQTLRKDLERVLERLQRTKSLPEHTMDAEERLFVQLWRRAERRGDYMRRRYEGIIHPIDRGEAHC